MTIKISTLPSIYCDWLINHPAGAYGEDTGIFLYGENELAERNDTYECEEYMPSHFIIGDDSGDTLYVMKKDQNSQAVFSTDMGYMNEDELAKETDNFLDWVENINMLKADN